MGQLREEVVANCGLNVDADVLAADLNGAGCEAGWLTSLMEVLADHLGQAAERLDPLRTARLGADVARIAHGVTERLTEQVIAAEERCCVLGRRCVKAAPTD